MRLQIAKCFVHFVSNFVCETALFHIQGVFAYALVLHSSDIKDPTSHPLDRLQKAKLALQCA